MRIAGTFVTLGAAFAVATASGQAPQTRRGAQAQPAASAAARPMEAAVPNPREMDELLALWEQNNGKLRSLTVAFERVDKSKVWGEEKFVGNAYLQSPNLACLHFKKVDGGNAKKLSDHERIVCTGQEVRQYDFKTQQIFVFPLDRNERKRALQEGPLPFLFNLKANEVKYRYNMRKMGEDKENYLIGVVPLEDRDKEVFSMAYIQLSKETFLPNRLLLVDPNQKDTQDYTFKQPARNEPINPVFFQALNIKGWKVVLNPGPEGPAQVGAGADPRQAPPGRPQVGSRPGAVGGRAPR